MQRLSEEKLLSAIHNGEPVEAELAGGGLQVKIREYVPYLCTAIHAGNHLRSELERKCFLSSEERLLEEDPFTDQLISSFPITITANDSRYEYDLNRSPDKCIYDTAWGAEVWKRPLTVRQEEVSREKHAAYYRILKALVAKIEKQFGGCLLLDMHSYNWRVRHYDYAPVFNIGTARINVRRWRKVLNVLEGELGTIQLPNIENEVGRNTVFRGLGYQAEFIRKKFPASLNIPLETKKVFMDETTGELFPLVMEKLEEGLQHALFETVKAFNENLKRSPVKTRRLLPQGIEPEVMKVDRALYRLAKNTETLFYVNPINVQREKRAFLSRKQYEPRLKYRPLRIDPYEFKERLYRLPVSQIEDPMIRNLYRGVVDSYATKVELLTHVGTEQFLYNSLRYYGEPSELDIENAKFILHAGALESEAEAEEPQNPEEAAAYFKKAANELGLDCKIAISSRLVAKAMVDNSRKTLFINRNAKLTKFELDALVQHELGIHMCTSINADKQPLKVLKLGLPGNTYTQEGLAVLNEYASGNLNLERLRQLSLRVVAVDLMLKGLGFRGVFRRLNEEHDVLAEDAFDLTLRVFRGGGFTKDYLYLSSFRDLVHLCGKRDITNLMSGKTSVDSLDAIDSLMERGALKRPTYTPRFCREHDISKNPVLDYLVSSIK